MSHGVIASSKLAVPAPGGGGPLFSDDFDQPNGALNTTLWDYGNPYDGGSAYSYVDNVVRQTGSSLSTAAIWKTEMPSADHSSQVDVTLDGAGTQAIGPIVRAGNREDAGRIFHDSYEFSWANYSGGVYRIIRWTGASETNIAQVEGVGATGTRTLRLEVVGDQLSGYVNDVLVLGPITDATHDGEPFGNYVGFKGYGDTAANHGSVNNFEADVIAPPALPVNFVQSDVSIIAENLDFTLPLAVVDGDTLFLNAYLQSPAEAANITALGFTIAESRDTSAGVSLIAWKTAASEPGDRRYDFNTTQFNDTGVLAVFRRANATDPIGNVSVDEQNFATAVVLPVSLSAGSMHVACGSSSDRTALTSLLAGFTQTGVDATYERTNMQHRQIADAETSTSRTQTGNSVNNTTFSVEILPA